MSIIPFNKASIVGNELAYIEDAVRYGVISGEGHFSSSCQALVAEMMGEHSHVLLTPSCTAALEMSSILLNLSVDDEVILPSFTFVTTATAPVLRGAKPVFADIDPVTLNIRADSIAEAISNRTKAVYLVPYGGVSCELDEIMEILAKKDLPFVEDAAHALGATYQGRPLGSFGNMATFSFHETKNVTCGEGGALVVNDKCLIERANIIRDKGTNRRSFKRGDVSFYTWVDIGSSYVMSDILAAFLYAQLLHIEKITRRRKELHLRYCEHLLPLRDKGYLTFIGSSLTIESSAHLFFVLLESETVRAKLQEHLGNHGIAAVFHYQPLHLSPYVVSNWGPQPSLPVTENIAPRLLRLPLYYSLTETEVATVANVISSFFGKR